MRKLLHRRGLLVSIAILIILLGLTGCGKNKEGTEPPEGISAEHLTAEKIVLTDQVGREVILEKPAQRVVSTYYISSAILVALDKADTLVGIERKADTRGLYQMAAPELLNLPAVGSGKGINLEEIAGLNPDLVILPRKLKDSVEQLEQLGIPVLVIDPETMENYNACVELLGRALGTEKRAAELLDYYELKLKEIEIRLQGIEKRPSVYISSGSSFLNTCTSKMYQNDFIELAGGVNVSRALENGYWAEISKEQLLMWNPDYILPVSYAEYSIEDIRKDIDLAEITAIQNNAIYRIPSAIEPWDYPTPSSILGILWLTHILHPDRYTEEEYQQEAREFYSSFFGITVDKSDLGLE